MPRLLLLGTEGCHLCEEAQETVAAYFAGSSPVRDGPLSRLLRLVAELYGLPSSSVEMFGLWFEVGMCYDMDRLYLTDDASCDLGMDLEGLLYPMNGARAVGYIPNQPIDLEKCKALMDEKQDPSAPVKVPYTPSYASRPTKAGKVFCSVWISIPRPAPCSMPILYPNKQGLYGELRMPRLWDIPLWPASCIHLVSKIQKLTPPNEK